MSNLQAAMGCAQLKRIDDLVKKKRLIFNWYYNQLIEIGNLSMNHGDQTQLIVIGCLL